MGKKPDSDDFLTKLFSNNGLLWVALALAGYWMIHFEKPEKQTKTTSIDEPVVVSGKMSSYPSLSIRAQAALARVGGRLLSCCAPRPRPRRAMQRGASRPHIRGDVVDLLVRAVSEC